MIPTVKSIPSECEPLYTIAFRKVMSEGAEVTILKENVRPDALPLAYFKACEHWSGVSGVVVVYTETRVDFVLHPLSARKIDSK